MQCDCVPCTYLCAALLKNLASASLIFTNLHQSPHRSLCVPPTGNSSLSVFTQQLGSVSIITLSAWINPNKYSVYNSVEAASASCSMEECLRFYVAKLILATHRSPISHRHEWAFKITTLLGQREMILCQWESERDLPPLQYSLNTTQWQWQIHMCVDIDIDPQNSENYLWSCIPSPKAGASHILMT